MVSLPRNQFFALVLGVCVLSAAIGSGLALLAQTGPSGAQGPAGPRGEQGPEGPSGAAEVEGLEAELGELREQVERVEEGVDGGELEGRLESEVAELGGVSSELCEEVGLFC
jgi:hypothetical protein